MWATRRDADGRLDGHVGSLGVERGQRRGGAGGWDYLRGEGARHPRLDEVSLRWVRDCWCRRDGERFDCCRTRLVRVRDDGSALERMANVVEKMGGDPRVMERPEKVLAVRLWSNRFRHPMAESDRFDVRGWAGVVALRRTLIPDAAIDPRVGCQSCRLRERYSNEATLLTIHASDDAWQWLDRILRTLRWDEDG